MGEPVQGLIPETTSEPLHEMSDARIRPLAYFLAGLGAALAVVGALIGILFNILYATINNQPMERRTASPSPPAVKEPALQVSSRADLEKKLARDEQTLRTTGWVDRERGIARVPIDAAIEIVEKNGLPKWPPVPTAPAGPNSLQRPAVGIEER
jgi:hypothetical protein